MIMKFKYFFVTYYVCNCIPLIIALSVRQEVWQSWKLYPMVVRWDYWEIQGKSCLLHRAIFSITNRHGRTKCKSFTVCLKLFLLIILCIRHHDGYKIFVCGYLCYVKHSKGQAVTQRWSVALWTCVRMEPAMIL